MRIRAYISAFRAGMIASNCKTGCIINDEEESIMPCFIHKAKIAELFEINTKSQ